MSIAIEAVWESGVFTPKTRPDLPEKASVHIIVKPDPVAETEDDRTGWTTAMELIGCIQGGAPDVAKNHDKYLYDKV